MRQDSVNARQSQTSNFSVAHVGRITNLWGLNFCNVDLILKWFMTWHESYNAIICILEGAQLQQYTVEWPLS